MAGGKYGLTTGAAQAAPFFKGENEKCGIYFWKN